MAHNWLPVSVGAVADRTTEMAISSEILLTLPFN